MCAILAHMILNSNMHVKIHNRITWPKFAVLIIDRLDDIYASEARVCNEFGFVIVAVNWVHFQMIFGAEAMVVTMMGICISTNRSEGIF